MSDRVSQLSEWYNNQCDGDWEHSSGILITTLDNPGWSVKINLSGTSLQGIAFDELERLDPEFDWVRCWVADDIFNGVGGSQNLGEILDTFLAWATWRK